MKTHEKGGKKREKERRQRMIRMKKMKKLRRKEKRVEGKKGEGRITGKRKRTEKREVIGKYQQEIRPEPTDRVSQHQSHYEIKYRQMERRQKRQRYQQQGLKKA